MHLVIVGGSDAGIAAALRARELDPHVEVTVVVADGFPNFSVCGIPYHVSGEVPDWRALAHRTLGDLRSHGLRLVLDTTVLQINLAAQTVEVQGPTGRTRWLHYDELLLATGASPVKPPIDGLDRLGPRSGVHLLHAMGDTLTLTRYLQERRPQSALIVGAGYIGLEMAEALRMRGLRVTQVEALPEVLPTVDAELGALIRAELERHNVEVVTATQIKTIDAETGRLRVLGEHTFSRLVDLVVVVAGVRPNTTLAATAGVRLGARGAIIVDEHMATGIPHVWAAGDCIVTHHRQLGQSYIPLGTTAHKQGRIAGENMIGGRRAFAGSLGTQVVKVFDLAAARTGLRDVEARDAGFDPRTVESAADDHKAYYPGAHRINMRWTADTGSRRLLGVQMVGHKDAAVAKRIDIAATGIHNNMTIDAISDLDLSYTPPLGSPWDAVQHGAQAWERAATGEPRH